MAKKKSSYYDQPSTLEKKYLQFGHVDNYLKTIQRNQDYGYLVKSIKELLNILNYSQEMRRESNELEQWGLPYKSHIIKYIDELILSVGLYPSSIGITFNDYNYSKKEKGEATITLGKGSPFIEIDINNGLSRLAYDLKDRCNGDYRWYGHEYTKDEIQKNMIKRFGYSGLSVTKEQVENMFSVPDGYNKDCNINTPLDMLHHWFSEYQFGYNILLLGFNQDFVRIMPESGYPYAIKLSQLNGVRNTQNAIKASERLHLDNKLRFQVLKRDNSTCKMCGRSVGDGVKLEIDHIVPVSKGGKTSLDNLQVLCYDCNRGKRDSL